LKEEEIMKQTKKLFALLLIICMVLAMVPAVSAAEVVTGEYYFDVYDHSISLSGNSLDNDNCRQSLTNYYEGINGKTKQLNWNLKGYSCSVNDTNRLNFVRDGRYPTTLEESYFRGKMVPGDWLAFTIDSPGEGKWAISFKHIATSYGAQKVDFYIIPDTEGIDIASNMTDEYFVGAINCNAPTPTAHTPTHDQFEEIDTRLNGWDAGAADTYIFVVKATEKSAGTGTYTTYDGSDYRATVYMSQMLMKPAVASGKIGDVETYYESADALAAAINGAADGTAFTLLADGLTTEIEIELPEGVTLDLNGKTLNATVDATQGTVTDATDGEGAIVGTSAVVTVGDNEVVLKQGNVCRIFDYELTVEDEPEVKDDGSVNFWFKAELDAAAYTMVNQGATGLTVGADMQWTPAGGAAANETAVMAADKVAQWAGVAGSGDYWFYVNVTGFDTLGDATGELKVTPTIGGNAGIPITYSVN
jgi:hypothetical protein